MAKYFMELSLVDYGCMKFLPSEIAAAALYIAMKADDGSEWTPTCEYYSMYTESKLLPCARRLASLITKTLDGSARLKVRHGCMNGKVPQEKPAFFHFFFLLYGSVCPSSNILHWLHFYQNTHFFNKNKNSYLPVLFWFKPCLFLASSNPKLVPEKYLENTDGWQRAKGYNLWFSDYLQLLDTFFIWESQL